MIYEFKCWACGATKDVVLSVDERNKKVVSCSHCGVNMDRVPSFKGGFKTEHPLWLNKDVTGSLQPPEERPIETRSEHDKYLKERGIVQI